MAKSTKQTVQVTDIEWEPYDQDITEEEFNDLVSEQPSSIEIEVDESDDIAEMIEEALYNDDLKLKRYKYKVL